MNKTVELLGDKAEYLLSHTCKTIDKSTLHLPSPHTVEEVWAASDRNIPTLNSLQRLLGHGRLGGTGYVSILPVDQGIEHTAGASFAPNPIYFDPENIVRLAIEGGCNGVASTLGVLGAVARRYAHKIPFVVKINHNELLTYPNSYDQVLFGSVEQAWEMGAVAVGATIYFGSAESRRQLTEIAAAFERAHDLGMATILWCYLRNNAFKKDGSIKKPDRSFLANAPIELKLLSVQFEKLVRQVQSTQKKLEESNLDLTHQVNLRTRTLNQRNQELRALQFLLAPLQDEPHVVIKRTVESFRLILGLNQLDFVDEPERGRQDLV